MTNVLVTFVVVILGHVIILVIFLFCSDIIFIYEKCKTFMIYNKKDKKLGLCLP